MKRYETQRKRGVVQIDYDSWFAGSKLFKLTYKSHDVENFQDSVIYFDNKMQAKRVRDAAFPYEQDLVVKRGPDHKLGETW